MSGVADAGDGYDDEEDRADSDSGDRQRPTPLTGLPDLAEREKAEDQAQQGPDDEQPTEQRAQQRRDGHAIDARVRLRHLIYPVYRL
ncbi:MAG: hypothetical protein WBV80_22760 [Mycobacterium sp.]